MIAYSQYCNIHYENEKHIRKFRKRIRSHESEFIEKIFMLLFDEHINIEKFNIVICLSKKEVNEKYFKLYGRKTKYIAFASIISNTIYFSSKNINKRIIAHELVHIIMLKYLNKNISVKLHEHIAKIIERLV